METGPSWKNCFSLRCREVMEGSHRAAWLWGRRILRQCWGPKPTQVSPLAVLHTQALPAPFPPAAPGEEGSCLSCLCFWHRGSVTVLTSEKEQGKNHYLHWLQPHLPPSSTSCMQFCPAPGPLQLLTLCLERSAPIFTRCFLLPIQTAAQGSLPQRELTIPSKDPQPASCHLVYILHGTDH